MSAGIMEGVVRASHPPSSSAESNIAEFHAISIPRRTYTGDFWFARCIDGALWFVLGDVAGKGAASAVWMAMIQEELDALLSQPAPPAQPCTIVRRLDEVLREEMPPNRFATLVAGRLGSDGSLAIANAGHPSPLLVRGDGSIERLPSNGPPVGILPNRCWGVTSATLEPGDLLVTYTDGLPEAQRIDGTELGIEGTEALARAVRGERPREGAARIADRLTRIALVEDDVTVLVVGR